MIETAKGTVKPGRSGVKLIFQQRVLPVKSFKTGVSILIFASLIVLWGTLPGKADGWEIGAHGGFSLTKGNASFHQYELYGLYPLPWSWRRQEALVVQTRLTGALGVLDSGSDTGATGTLGLQLAFRGSQDRFQLFLGSGATLLSESTYSGYELGGPFQFTSRVGLAFRLFSGLHATLEVRHISNADIYDPNPGLDLVLVGLRHTF